ncbi:peptidylprolyl isomerase [Akkermansiaceae bacterium]|nr:peptidylprolyl isomerase [Akkermansiaceae bacterium]
MKTLNTVAFLLFAFFITSCGAEPAPKKHELTGKELTATIFTDIGDIKVILYAEKTPVTVANFVNLAQRGYYNGSNFHRVVPGFVSQGGMHPSGNPRPGYTIKNETYTENSEIAELKHSKAGMLSMARTNQLHTNGSQWYITHDATPSLDGKYTVFGEVTEGLDLALKMNQGTLIKKIEITSDASELLKLEAENVKMWNKVLDANFPDLAPAS